MQLSKQMCKGMSRSSLEVIDYFAKETEWQEEVAEFFQNKLERILSPFANLSLKELTS